MENLFIRLDSAGIQQHICNILEGGKEAFLARKNKYTNKIYYRGNEWTTIKAAFLRLFNFSYGRIPVMSGSALLQANRTIGAVSRSTFDISLAMF